MSDFILTSPETLSENVFDLIGKDWMLITAGDNEKYNTMTASWGGMGVLWNESVAFAFIRPQRYTYEFTEANEFFTLSFFGEEYRDALRFCGSKSGRDHDKAAMTGLTAVHEDGVTYFSEAKLVIVCKKLYFQDMTAESFIDKSIIDKHYPNNDFHRMYVGKIVKCLKKA